jgi:hypothetical protein
MPAAVLARPAQTTASVPATQRPAPTSPPIRACELDEGMPFHQVSRFQAMAPIRAPKITRSLMTLTSMMPDPTVLATCRPKKAKAMKLKKAAHTTAQRADSTRVDTMVAIELAASCSPFRKSKISATAISAIRVKVTTA